MFGCGRPVAQETSRGVEFFFTRQAKRIAGMNPLKTSTCFTPLAPSAINIGNETFGFDVVREKTARNFKFRQSAVEVTLDAVVKKRVREMSLAQVGPQPQSFACFGASASLQVFARSPKVIE